MQANQGAGAAGNYQQALQMKGVDAGTAQRLAQGSVAGANAGALAPGTKKLMAAAFKKDFASLDSVQVRKAAYSSQSLSATAFVSKKEATFAKKESAASASKKELLAHEATHVAQQRAAPSAPAGPAYPGSAAPAAARGGGGLASSGVSSPGTPYYVGDDDDDDWDFDERGYAR